MDNVLGSITDAPEPDLKICCGTCELTVHKSVIYPQSDYFAQVCEENPLEAKTGKLTLNDDDPDTLERMICFLYHQDYQDDDNDNDNDYLSDTSEPLNPPNAEDQASSTTLTRIIANINVYALAEKYAIPPLCALAKAKFTALVCRIRRHQDFSLVLLAIYESSVGGGGGGGGGGGAELRSIVSRICASRMRAVVDNAGFEEGSGRRRNGEVGRNEAVKKEVERRMRALGLL